MSDAKMPGMIFQANDLVFDKIANKLLDKEGITIGFLQEQVMQS